MQKASKSYAFVLPWPNSIGSPGGVNQVVENLIQECNSAGEYHPILIENDWISLKPVIEQRSDYTYIRVRMRELDNLHIKTPLAFIFSLPFALRTWATLATTYRIEVFNVHYPSFNAIYWIVLRNLRLFSGKVILSFHGNDILSAKKLHGWPRVVYRYMLRQADAVISCSQALQSEVLMLEPHIKAHVIYNGIDECRFVQKARAASILLEPESNVGCSVGLLKKLHGFEFILTVATFEEKKGLDVLLRAFAEVGCSNSKLALALVGRPNGTELGLRELARELKITERVFFFENVPHAQINFFLQNAKFFCLPSRFEPFGIAILEAGIYRLPVVASRVGGIPEIIIDGETGLLVEPDDAKSLANALNSILLDKERACGFGEHLYQHVVSNFSWKRAYNNYLALLTKP